MTDTNQLNLWHDLRRRRMFRVAGLYIVGAWMFIEVATVFFPAWGIPDTALRFLIIAAALCFPIALVFGWIFDITSDGIVRTRKAGEDDSPDTKLQRLDYIILAAFLGLGGVVLFGSAEKVMDEIEKTPTSIAAIEKLDNSIAILPFENLDSNPDTGYFSDGVAEEILQKLSSLKTLHVLARTSSFAFKGSDLGPAQISDFLGVRYMLQGSVRRDRDTVRITARLIDDTGFQIWSESFDRKLEGIFAIQKEIATTVAGRIVDEIVYSSDLPAVSTTENMDAYNQYLIGRAYLNARTPGWREKAEIAFQQAIDFDDQFAPPYAGLAVTISVMADPDQETFDKAWRLAETSVRLDSKLAEGHAAIGILSFFPHRTDLESSVDHLRLAIELDPSLSIAYGWLSIALQRQGHFSDAAEVEDKGLAIDPLNPILTVNTAWRYADGGYYDRAEQLLLRATQTSDPAPIVYISLDRLYTAYGRFSDALKNEKAFFSTFNGKMDDVQHVFEGIADSYYRLGLIADGNYFLDRNNPEQGDDFDAGMSRTFTLQRAGQIDRMEALLTRILANPNFGLVQQPEWQLADVGELQILVGNYESGIALMETPFDVESLEIIDVNDPLVAIRMMQTLAYAYSHTGQTGKTEQLLAALQKRLVEMSDSGVLLPNFLAIRSLNHALLGDADSARATFTAAVNAGYREYFLIVNDPAWAEMLALPGFTELLQIMKQDIDRQRDAVVTMDAEDGFRALVEQLFPL